MEWLKRQRPFACVALVGGVLIAAGSEWKFAVTNQPLTSAPSGRFGHTAITTTLVHSLRHASLSTWMLLALVVGAVVVSSLAADAAGARPARASLGWAMLCISVVLGAYVACLGVWLQGTTLSLGTGFLLASAGCVLVTVGATLWLTASRGPRYVAR